MLADKTRSVCVGMNAVSRIELRFGLSFKCLIEKLVKRNIHICIFIRELANDGKKTRKIRSYSLLVLAIEKILTSTEE